MLYSHDDKQEKVAKQLLNLSDDPKGEIQKIFESYRNINSRPSKGNSGNRGNDTDPDMISKTIEDSSKKKDSSDKYTIQEDEMKKPRYRYEDAMWEKQFTENVMMAMIKALRNLGLARESHVSSLLYQLNMYKQENDYLEDISSFSSTSKEGLIAKIFPFLGGASGLTFAITAGDYEAGNGQKVLTSSVESIRELLSGSTLPLGLDFDSMVLLFIASGLAMVTLVTFILKYWNKRSLAIMERTYNHWLEKNWRKKIRPSMADCLFQLYKDLQCTMSNFYPNYKEDDFSDDVKARTTIEDEIIQPESIELPSRFNIKEAEIKGGKGNDEEG